jgi:divalent metal cation (Fe/Co/Zn/Cd) transporter
VHSDRLSHLGSALRLSFITIAWNGVVGAAALSVALIAGSLALAAFALSALLDSGASVVLVWRFRTEQSDPLAADRLERRAQTWIVSAMIAVATYIGVQAARSLLDHAHPRTSGFGVALAVVSMIFLPVLGIAKLRVASHLSSAALRGDGVLTISAAALATITLVALLLDSTFGWWWADASAAALIAAALAAEAIRVTTRHRFG